MADDMDDTADDSDDCILRFPEILRKTGLSKSQIYRLIARWQFPSPGPAERKGGRVEEEAYRQMAGWLVR